MTHRSWPWLLLLLMFLHVGVVAADSHPVAGATAPAAAAQTDSATSSTEPDTSHEHCSHCYHCSWHALSSFPVVDAVYAPAAPLPYRQSLRVADPTPLFRPPRHSLA